ncbi:MULTISPECIES: hypothetical protein [unclassified Xanthobacter]|uniref:hypothetical protein n=1 Tax=unclassified Xanthobacter TaxID=2623496 RepID=UPI001F18510B|nr:MULTISPECIES: hypothetical protein [unclassified Xanthobacter]
MAIDGRRLERDVLDALTKNSVLVTYVLRNTLVMPCYGYGWIQHLETHQVLAACRRLEARGHVEEAPTHYATYKAWQITPAGRDIHQRKVQAIRVVGDILEDPDRPGWWTYRSIGADGTTVGGFPTPEAARRAARRSAEGC